MAGEPAVKRAIAFFDGQNLYRHAKDTFGHHPANGGGCLGLRIAL